MYVYVHVYGGPIESLAAAGKYDILLAELDLLHRIADAVGAG